MNTKKSAKENSQSCNRVIATPSATPSATPNEGAEGRSMKGESDAVELHFRRCHLCNRVSELASERVHSCDTCGKVMAPFFFFEDRATPTLSDFELRPIVSPGQHPPVRGLTAIW